MILRPSLHYEVSLTQWHGRPARAAKGSDIEWRVRGLFIAAAPSLLAANLLMLDDIHIFANPIAGRGRGRVLAERLDRHFREHGYVARLFLERADEINADELEAARHATIVIGGDGTLRAVAHRVLEMAAQRNRPSGDLSPLLLVPMGTANLMGKHLGIRWDDAQLEQQVLQTVKHQRVVEVDTARANRSLFFLMAGIGFDAKVVHELDRMRNGPISMWTYLRPAAKALAQYHYPPLRVTVDEKLVYDAGPALAFVGNIPEYGTGFPVLPMARPDDGLLDVCVIPCRSVADLTKIFLQAACGEHVLAEGVIYVKGKRIRVESQENVEVQVDGEAAGHLPLEVEILPLRVPFLVQ